MNLFQNHCIFFMILTKSCLICESAMDSFVVGGDKTKIANFPHSAFLSVKSAKESWICGSSVLNQMLLLTAAHCLDELPQNSTWKIIVFAGHENLEKVGVLRTVYKVLIHSKYNAYTVVNDIALAYLKTSLPLGKNIKRVIIRPDYPKVKDAFVAGWGVVNDDTLEESVILTAVRQKMRSGKICERIGNLAPGMMCAGSIKRNADRPSMGDSGSALITTKQQQIGLVSYRVESYPGLVIYTNVSYFYTWITEKSKKLICKS